MVWDQGVQTIVSLPDGDHGIVSVATETVLLSSSGWD